MIESFDYSGMTLQKVTGDPSYRLTYANGEVNLFGYFETTTHVGHCCTVEEFSTEQEGLDRIQELGLYNPFTGTT